MRMHPPFFLFWDNNGLNWNQLAGGRRIAVLGDVMVDEHIYGSVHRISPEAPVPVVQVTSRSHHPGGAANVAMNIAALTGDVSLAGIAGADEASRILRAILSAKGIGMPALVESSSRCTSRKSRVLAHGYHHLVRFDEEVSDPLDAQEEARLLAALDPILDACEALVISDYAKGVLTPAVCAHAIARVRGRNIPVIADPKDVDFTKYRGASVITPNYGEAVAAARFLGPGPAGDSDAEVEAIGATLLEAYGCAVVLTRGAKGMSVFERDVPVAHIAARARQVFDVTGAGDTVVAVLALALAAGLPLSEAAALSTEAAGRVIQMPGTAVVTLAELLASPL
jgi:D-beta-D-heptose 7-phosphate kinase/D-beta-D-heptose 1-phosphate adenosyltransferase